MQPGPSKDFRHGLYNQMNFRISVAAKYRVNWRNALGETKQVRMQVGSLLLKRKYLKYRVNKLWPVIYYGNEWKGGIGDELIFCRLNSGEGVLLIERGYRKTRDLKGKKDVLSSGAFVKKCSL